MSSGLWEVDPETRSKLLAIQKTNGNDRCCDCDAPSPQWASPKFGTFICLNCAGTHRGLGVHISFVRSITMDAFKTAEIQRMELGGGNQGWKEFFDNHEVTLAEGRSFEDSTVRERYEGVVGEEWKERLGARVEGKEYVEVKPEERERRKKEERRRKEVERERGKLAGGGVGVGGEGGKGGGGQGAGSGRKEQNEAYFARLGDDNASRPTNLPPSEGGRYAGFGGGMPPSPKAEGGGALPGVDDFQKDPVAALTKGFGWFTTTVGKGAKTVNDSYLQPTAKQIAESDFAAQARNTATHLGQNIQTGALGAAEQFNRFVEGSDNPHASRSHQQRQRVEPERKDFWDDFAALGEERSTGAGGLSARRGQGSSSGGGSRSGAIGTAAMKKGGSSGGGLSGTGGGKKDGWDDDW
ncbi:Zn finger-containing GTPase- Activating Protein for ARF [Arachnomyces sp. PD_36]|nr:Zn finger-containing GTPase- Activating Protein for ARF [Arachnomyces sp. PD_36]